MTALTTALSITAQEMNCQTHCSTICRSQISDAQNLDRLFTSPAESLHNHTAMIKTDTSPESLSEVVFMAIYSVINSLVKLTEQHNQNQQQDHKSSPAKKQALIHKTNLSNDKYPVQVCPSKWISLRVLNSRKCFTPNVICSLFWVWRDAFHAQNEWFIE